MELFLLVKKRGCFVHLTINSAVAERPSEIHMNKHANPLTHDNALGTMALIRRSRTSLGVLTMFLVLIFLYVAYDHWHEAYENALIAARTLIEKDITYRRWNALHGGVYAPVTETTPPNPYLNVPERDIVTTAGKKLTLVNPAYMTRQVHELEQKHGSTRGHITSLRVLRPGNSPDEWEAEALRAFEHGETEVSSIAVLDGTKYLRVIHSLKTEKSCLKCHAIQGYREGDIRGAISASIPMRPFYAGMMKSMATEGMLYFFYWLVGSGLILSRTRREENKTLALRTSEERYHAMVDAFDGQMYICSQDYRLEFMNQKILAHTGRNAVGEICYKALHGLGAACPWCVNDRVFRGEVVEREFQYPNNGRWYFAVSTPIYNADGTVSKQAMIHDITERKNFEQILMDREEMFRTMSGQFNALLDAIPDSITLLSPDYQILWANRAAGKKIGREPRDLEGKYCYDLWFNRPMPCEECPARESFLTGEAYEKHVTKDDRKLDVRTVPVMGANGVVNVIRVGRDVTEQVKLEDQLRQAQKLDSVGTLAGGIAHDFNNILSAIIGYGQITLMKMGEENPHRANIEQMLTAADRAAYLTQGLLAFSRKQLSNRKQVDLNHVISRTGTFLRRIIREDIEFRTQLHTDAVSVMADANQIEQVLMNLATNARDAMPKGGVLAVTTAQIRLDEEFSRRHGYGQAGMYALMTISDSGVGMDEETRLRIFEPFFTTKDVGKGTGLGLAVIYGIIKQHDGFINVYSEPGEGTTFRIYLPLVATDTTAEADIEETVMPAGGSETILLAEDDEMVRKLTQAVLEDFGYRVIVAVDGEDAVGKFMEHKDRIHLLLSDLIMPKKNGREVYDRIREVRPDIRVIFASGYSPDIVRDKASLGSGATIVYKPISPMDLLKQVRKVLDDTGASLY